MQKRKRSRRKVQGSRELEDQTRSASCCYGCSLAHGVVCAARALARQARATAAQGKCCPTSLNYTCTYAEAIMTGLYVTISQLAPRACEPRFQQYASLSLSLSWDFFIARWNASPQCSILNIRVTFYWAICVFFFVRSR